MYEDDGDEQPREHLLLNDFQHYLENRGLRNEPVGQESALNVSETKQRLEDEAAHQERVHRVAFEHFGKHDEQHSSAKLAFLESFDKSKILLNSATGPVEAEVFRLSTYCDAVYALASTCDMYKGNSSPVLELSLEQYSQESVQAFVDMACFCKPPQDVSSDSIVECCQIAHYLQCSRVLEPVVDILVDAVDTDNCKSLLELADRLNLPLLFERSLSHMMQSLEETQEVWEDLTPELRGRVELMKQAMQSAILAQSSCRLYFSSLDEYLAMFAETLQYNRERLMDAKERQEETRETHLVRSRAWEYNQSKVDRQEQRFRRLEHIMKQQKKIFASTTSNYNPVAIKKQREK